MAASESAPASGGQRVVSARAIALRGGRWLRERKLSRRTPVDLAAIAFGVLVIRLYAAAACFAAMLLAAWAGAFTHAVSAHNWHVFRTLNDATLLAASTQAGRYQIGLIPVVLAWAVLLLGVPRGYTFAFRAAVAAAAGLGYLGVSPPLSQATERLRAVSYRVGSFDTFWLRDGLPVLIASVALAYILQASAAGVSERLVHLHRTPFRQSGGRPRGPSAHLGLAHALAMPVLILLTLLSATWAATVLRLAAESAPGPYGFQGGLYQARYLIMLAVLAVGLSRAYGADRWLAAGTVLVVAFFLFPDVLTVPSFLEVPVGQAQLTRLGGAWGANALWAALLVFIPAVVLGHYLAGRLLRLAGRAA